MLNKSIISMLLAATALSQVQASALARTPAPATPTTGQLPALQVNVTTPPQSWSAMLLQPQVIFGIGSSIVALGGVIWGYHELTRARRNEQQLKEVRKELTEINKRSKLHLKLTAANLIQTTRVKKDTEALKTGQTNILADTTAIKTEQGSMRTTTSESFLGVHNRIGAFELNANKQFENVSTQLGAIQGAQEATNEKIADLGRETHAKLDGVAADIAHITAVTTRTHEHGCGEKVPEKGQTGQANWQHISFSFFPSRLWLQQQQFNRTLTSASSLGASSTSSSSGSHGKSKLRHTLVSASPDRTQSVSPVRDSQ